MAAFSLWTGVFWDGISSILDETVIPLRLGRHCLVRRNTVYNEKVRMTVWSLLVRPPSHKVILLPVTLIIISVL
jgi:hypothetical protein